MTTATLAAPSAAPTGRRATETAGVGMLVRLALRRSRWFWAIWIFALWITIVATRTTYNTLVEPGGDLGATMAALAGNPTMRAMLGPPFDLLTVGGFIMFRVGTFVACAAAMMAALGVIRATRAEEEDGRIELLRSGAIGRHAPLLAGVLVALGGCGLLGLLIAVSQSAAAPPVAGAVVTGVGIALVGAVWVGVGAVAAQLSESARAARGIALGILGGAYLVRALTDGSADGSTMRSLNWLSPLDWAALARPYSGERWWVLLLPAALAVALIALAFRLESRRDLGAGMRAASPGPADAAASLSSADGLAWRLDRAGIIGWLIGIVIFAYAVGTLSGSFDQLISDSPQMADMFRRMGRGAADLKAAFYVAMLAIMVVVIAMHGLQLIARVNREEDLGHTELMLATATSRRRLLGGHLTLALLAPTVLLLATGALLATPEAISSGNARVIWDIMLAAGALLPGVWLVVGVGTALVGLAPRLFPVAWALLGWTLFIAWVGQLLNLPDAVTSLTPFAALPGLPVQPMNWTPWLIETVMAIVLIVIGFVGYRRRDIG